MKEAAVGSCEDSTWVHVSEAAGVAEEGTMSKGESDRETEVSRVSSPVRNSDFIFRRMGSHHKA